MTHESLGGLLGAAPPTLAQTALAQALDQHYGLAGQHRTLTSERDMNVRLSTPTQDYVVKLTNPAEPAEVTDFQTRALLHLAPARLPVPQVILTRRGETSVATPQGILRVLSYLKGKPQHLTPKSTAQCASLASMAAQISLGLQNFSHPAARHVLQWDLKHAAGLQPMLAAIPEQALRGFAQAALDRFTTQIAPTLPDLRWQVVHNDLNPHNVLTSPDDPDRISGVLDFGDMVETPLICDAAIAAAYQLDTADPMASLLTFARAYHATLPLTLLERQVFPDLVAIRMVTTLAITSTRAARYPENASYILRNFDSARDGLMALAKINRQDLLTALETL